MASSLTLGGNLVTPVFPLHATRTKTHAACRYQPSRGFSSKVTFQSSRKASAVKASRRLIVQSVAAPGDVPTLREAESGIEMPLVRIIGDVEQRCIGIATKKQSIFGPFKYNSYGIGLYVNAELCAKELGIRDRGGMELVSKVPNTENLPLCDIEVDGAISKTVQYVLCNSKTDSGSDVEVPVPSYEHEGALCDALLDGAFSKTIQITVCTDQPGRELADAIYQALEARMRLMGSTAELQTLVSVFEGRTLTAGTEVAILWRMEGNLEVAIRESDPETVKGVHLPLEELAKHPVISIHSNSLCRAFFEMYLGENAIAPEFRAAAAHGAAKLLESERISSEYRHRSIISEKKYKD
uniref:Chalcone isomerase domain-containing protein n=1 Tax=Pyramimonas obovata TaxID=1411642 RepID=A0A7S0N4V3_9CHLO|eukprot:CAMPEP_0118925702 /NCGR_PEP_ID=MMETSP1169-20130426/3539_1 /TAXON_ID=36882 /ORGANISM="Pyramimonas obovata, Strain CCMP722" /LENGTH=353 /DNA_ID=CAMNT_0006867073 /DNA_START=219 /DNA_END=1280 /DNA_ORIENTATION=-